MSTEIPTLVKRVFEAVPTLYEDLLRPATLEVGQALKTAGKAVNLPLLPVSALLWTCDQFREKILPLIEKRLAERLAGIPGERLQLPNPEIAGPVLANLQVSGGIAAVREMYVKLLATAMDRDNALHAHPAFVEIVRQLLPDEAVVVHYLSQFKLAPVVSVTVGDQDGIVSQPIRHLSTIGSDAGCTEPSRSALYVDNLARLGLIEVVMGQKLMAGRSSAYNALVTSPEVQSLQMSLQRRSSQPKLQIEYGFVRLTTFGTEFCVACIDMKQIVSDSRRSPRVAVRVD